MRQAKPVGYVPAPTARACLANGFQVFADDVIPLVVVCFAVLSVRAAFTYLITFDGAPRFIGLVAGLLIAAPLEYGMSFVCLRAVRSGTISFEHLIAVLNRYWSVIAAIGLLTMILPGAFGFLFLPGVYVYCVTRFVPFLLLEDELDTASAIKESIRLSHRHLWPLFAITAVGFSVTTLGMFSILGLIPALIWWNLSIASLYHSIARPPRGWEVEDQESLEAADASQAEE